MILLSNTTEQTLQPGQSIIFDEVILHSGSGECHRRNTSAVKMRSNGVYEVHFSGNVGGETAGTQVELSLDLSGSVLPETLMLSTPAAVDIFNNVSTATLVKNCCGDYDRISVVNTGDVPVVVSANSSFYIKRVS